MGRADRAADQPRDVVLPPSALVRRAAQRTSCRSCAARGRPAAASASGAPAARPARRRTRSRCARWTTRRGRATSRSGAATSATTRSRSRAAAATARAPSRPSRTLPPAVPAADRDAAGTEYEIVDELRQRVRFMTTNLVEPGGFRPSHDVIFCHNVLIYFSPARRDAAPSRGWPRRLALGGYLLLGPGEAPHDRPAGLEPVVVSGVRAFQRRGAQAGGGARMTPSLDASGRRRVHRRIPAEPAGDSRPRSTAAERDRLDRVPRREAYRLIHALKGAASMVGLAAFGYLLNVAEELLERSIADAGAARPTTSLAIAARQHAALRRLHGRGAGRTAGRTGRARSARGRCARTMAPDATAALRELIEIETREIAALEPAAEPA